MICSVHPVFGSTGDNRSERLGVSPQLSGYWCISEYIIVYSCTLSVGTEVTSTEVTLKLFAFSPQEDFDNVRAAVE